MLGLKLHFYLDDWLLRNTSKNILKVLNFVKANFCAMTGCRGF
jgi:hypothetical protein